MSAQLELSLIPELETDSFEYAIACDTIFFKMKTETNWHVCRPSTLISQIKTLAEEVDHLKRLMDLKFV